MIFGQKNIFNSRPNFHSQPRIWHSKWDSIATSVLGYKPNTNLGLTFNVGQRIAHSILSMIHRINWEKTWVTSHPNLGSDLDTWSRVLTPDLGPNFQIETLPRLSNQAWFTNRDPTPTLDLGSDILIKNRSKHST